MPTRVQSRPAEMTRSSSEKYHDYDPINSNKNVQHKEALRLALGSILTPKRPITPSSRSSSGTASPAHPASFSAPGSPQLPPPPHSTPTHGQMPDGYLQARHVHQPHTPSKLGLTDSSENSRLSGSPPRSSVGSPAESSKASSPDLEHPPPLSLPASLASEGHPMHAPSPHPASHNPPSPPATATVPEVSGKSGSGTPKARFLETLQSKSAWDALIHGSFS